MQIFAIFQDSQLKGYVNTEEKAKEIIKTYTKKLCTQLKTEYEKVVTEEHDSGRIDIYCQQTGYLLSYLILKHVLEYKVLEELN